MLVTFSPPRCWPAVRWALSLALGLAAAVLPAKPEWKPIPAAELAATPPENDPDAVAEVLSARIELVVRNYKATQRNFQRVKVYSERAVEAIGKLAVEYTEGEKLSDLAARVVHPDGRTVELPDAQFQESVLGRSQLGRLRAKRLVVPHLAAGDIVELQWRIDADGRFKGSRFVYAQQQLPVRHFEFMLRNTQSGPMNLAAFGATKAHLERKGMEEGRIIIEDLPAYVEEEDLPPAFNMRASVLVMYGELPPFESTAWGIAAEALKQLDAVQCAPGKEMYRAVPAILGDGFREEQLRRLYDYCQQQIVNVAFDESAASREEREKFHPPRDARKVWADRRGNPLEVNCLFAALAKAAGFEARLTFSADRNEVMSVQFSHGWFFMKTSGVLVKLEGNWRLFAPGERAVPFGASRWQRENTETFTIENNFIHWENVETSYQQQARLTRRGRLVVDPEGTLDGDVHEEREGPEGIAWREEHWSDSPLALEEAVRDAVHLLLPEAEVTGVAVENMTETAQPLRLRYHLRLPGYATAAGDRWQIVPSVFYLHAPSRYAAAKRVNAIWWKYPRQEVVDLDLVLPSGWTCENTDAPGAVIESEGKLSSRARLDWFATENRLHYRLETTLGRSGATTFPASAYPTLRQFLNRIHAVQTHTLIVQAKP